IVGKIRLELTPKVNHWWNVPLYVSSRGLNTSIIPYGNRSFEIEFDFVDHQLVIRTTDPRTAFVALAPRSVADFYREVMAALRSLNSTFPSGRFPFRPPVPFPSVRKRFTASSVDDRLRRCG